MDSSAALAQLPDIFDHSLIQSAQHLLHTGGVSDVRVLQAGAVVTGVAVAQAQPGAAQSRGHRVYVRRRSAGIESECSCGETAPCVHVVAVLIAAANETLSHQGASSESSSLRAATETPADSSAP